MKELVSIIDFVFYKLKDPLKKLLLNAEFSVIIFYCPFFGNWFTKSALKFILEKINNGSIDPLMRELHYFSSVKNGEIIIKRINDAQTINDWNNAINSGMQPSNTQKPS